MKEVSENLKDIRARMTAIGQAARIAAAALARASTASKNTALEAMAEAIVAGSNDIQAENAADLAAGQDNLSAALLDRLELTPARIETMAEGLCQVASLPDPVGEVTDLTRRPSGIEVGRIDRKSVV